MILKKLFLNIEKLKEILVVLMINLALRVASSLVLAPFFLWIAYINNVFFYLFLLLIFIISLYELKLVFVNKKILYFFLFFLILAFLFSILSVRGSSNNGFYYFLWVILIVWLSDIGGYIFGNILKGPVLSRWSPKKTFSGLFGSLILSQCAFFIPSKLDQDFDYNITIFVTQFFLSLIAVFGDLFFSFIKRKHDIKDYSNLIPGHGGLLDRIDGMIFVMIFAYLIKIDGY
jgi:phosphatidate cytidylyltransferase